MAPLQWDGRQLGGEPWQGIRYLSIEFHLGTDHPAVVTTHLNHPGAPLDPDDVHVTGGRRRGVPPYEVAIIGSTIVISFRGLGDHAPYTVTIGDSSDPAHPVHPFFASAEFRFTIDCDAGDCSPSDLEARRARVQPPAVDLLTKDFTGFVRLLTDWVGVRHPHVTDLSSASFERMMLELIAWFGDMLSYHQDRVANEAFIDTASQRISLRQHAVLLGTTLDDGQGPTTVLAFDPSASGFVPAGLQERVRSGVDEVPVVFVVTRRTRVLTANNSDQLIVAAFTGAVNAFIPAGTRRLLLWGNGTELAAGDHLAFVQGSFSQIVTLSHAPIRRSEAGWVSSPNQQFVPGDPLSDITELQWSEPLERDLTPWSTVTPLRLYANLADAVYGAPRRAAGGPGTTLARGDVRLALSRRTSIVTHASGTRRLRALRLPEGPVVHDADENGGSRPAVELIVSREQWSQVDHLHKSYSYDLHYTAEAAEDGIVWLRFGDGVHGRDIPVNDNGELAVDVEVRYRIGDPTTGNLGLGTLIEIVRPPAGTDEADALDALGAVRVANVVRGSGGRRPHTLQRIKEELPWSLRHGPLERAVALEDYATAAMQVTGTARATARQAGGIFNTVMVLVDPQGAGDLPEELRQRVHTHLERLRMTGREHIVLAAEYVPLDVELVICPTQGTAPHVVRSRVAAELEPGSSERPGWFHPDRLTFGSVLRLGDLLAFVQGIPGVRSVKATAFRPLGDTTGPEVRDTITLGRTKVARLDADPDVPEHGRLRVLMAGLDADAASLVVDGAVTA